jgi:hypothetical protein
MATEIKAIKCPQCGSTQNTQIKPDFFKCSNCGTEYYIDNDDININYNYKNTPATPPPAAPGKTRGGCVILLVILGAVVIGLIKFISYQTSGSASAAESSVDSAMQAEKEHYSNSSMGSLVFTRSGREAQPLLLTLSYRQYMEDEPKTGVYLSFYDLLHQKELNNKQMFPAGEGLSMGGQLRRFSNGDIYIVFRGKKIFQLDPNTLMAQDVSTSLFKNQPKLQSGIATVDFTGESQGGDGFSLLTNDGVTLRYYPLVDKVYTQSGFDEATDGFKTLLPGSREVVYFDFTSQGIDFADEKLQLMKVRYKANPGGPEDRRYGFSWRRDYGRSGFFTDADPYTKVLISKQDKDAFRILSFTDLTPGRLYFDPAVVLGNDRDLLITFRVNAAPDASTSLQSLDVNTGTVKWTLPLSYRKPETVTRFANGYVALWNDGAMYIDTTGKVITEYKIK